MTDQQEAERGRLAQAVLDNPVYVDSFAALEAEFTQQWKASRSRDEREEIHSKLLLLGKVKGIVEGYMRAGKIAEAQIAHKQSLMERALGRFKAA